MIPNIILCAFHGCCQVRKYAVIRSKWGRKLRDFTASVAASSKHKSCIIFSLNLKQSFYKCLVEHARYGCFVFSNSSWSHKVNSHIPTPTALINDSYSSKHVLVVILFISFHRCALLLLAERASAHCIDIFGVFVDRLNVFIIAQAIPRFFMLLQTLTGWFIVQFKLKLFKSSLVWYYARHFCCPCSLHATVWQV